MSTKKAIYFLPTPHYKTNTILVRFIQPFDKDLVNERVLLPQVLLSGSRDFPSKQAIQLQSDVLYGSDIQAHITRVGNTSITIFQLSFLQQRFVKEHDFYDQVLAFLASIIYRPRMVQNRLLKKTILQEKRLLKENLEAIVNDKLEYSYQRFREHMFQNETYATPESGVIHTLHQVSQASMQRTYEQMLQDSMIEIDLAGSADLKRWIPKIEAQFKTTPKRLRFQWVDREMTSRNQVQHIKETLAIKQSRLYLGYRTYTYINDADAMALRVLNVLLGDFDQSFLFQVIREQLHLAYYVQSTLFLGKGFLSIMAGIDPSKAQLAIDSIQAIVSRIQAGDFSDEDLHLAKNYLAEQERRAMDIPGAQMHRFFVYRHVFHKPYNLREFFESLFFVGREELIAVAQKIKLDTIYLLTEDNHEVETLS